MKQEVKMFVDMTDENDGCLMVTVDRGEKVHVHIHGTNCPVTLQLTGNQAFNLLVELKAIMKDIPLT